MNMAQNAPNQDAFLLSQYLESGDERAFEKLVANHASMLTATATRICGKDDAPDAIQAALITFANKASQIQKHNSVGAWLHRVVTLEAMSLRRHRIQQKERKQRLAEEMTKNERPHHSELVKELDTTISSLNSKDREVVILHYLEGESFRTIAKRLGGTEAAWQKRSIRAIGKLTRKLQLRGIAVPAATIATLLASQPGEAATSQVLCQKLATQALAQKSLTLSSTSTSLFGLMNIKLATLLTFATGLALSTGWTALRHSQKDPNHNQQSHSSSLSNKNNGNPRTARGPQREDLLSALARLDQELEPNSYLASNIRAAIFESSLADLPALIAFLQEVEHPERFPEIAISCYARWAELDAEGAWEAMLDAPSFRLEAERAVVQTWIHLDPKAAFEKISQDPKESYQDAIVAYGKRYSGLDPQKMAEFVAQLALPLPAAAEELFPIVAKAWAMEDPEAAGEWIVSSEDVAFRDEILEDLVQNIAENQGSPGVKLADLIEDPELRAEARMDALGKWAASLGLASIQPNNQHPTIDISNGVPSTWSLPELQHFSTYFMSNFSKDWKNLVAIAHTEEERAFIHQGVVSGSAISDPSISAEIIPLLSADYVTSSFGKRELKTVFARWKDQDIEGLNTWLSTQPAGEKTEALHEILKQAP